MIIINVLLQIYCKMFQHACKVGTFFSFISTAPWWQRVLEQPHREWILRQDKVLYPLSILWHYCNTIIIVVATQHMWRMVTCSSTSPFSPFRIDGLHSTVLLTYYNLQVNFCWMVVVVQKEWNARQCSMPAAHIWEGERLEEEVLPKFECDKAIFSVQ